MILVIELTVDFIFFFSTIEWEKSGETNGGKMITVPMSVSSPYMKVTSYSDASAIGKKPAVSRSRNRS